MQFSKQHQESPGQHARSISNRYRQSDSSRPFFQAKLTVNQPNDVYEQQADAMADHVMRMRDNQPPTDSFFKPAITPIQRKCAHCEQEEKELQRKEHGDSTMGEAPAIVGEVLHGSTGKSLDPATRSFMEPKFGYDFSSVKVHEGQLAAKSAKAINALAYTSGNSIVFGEGQYRPAADSGKKLLAHELTHVIQQNPGLHKKPAGGLSTELEEGVGVGGVVQRDLAVEPPNAMEATVVLTPDEIQAAIRWNQRRFHDPYNIMNVRDVIGLPKYPAIIDEDFINAVLRWQAGFGLTQDGKFGATTTGTVVDELTAEGSAADAENLALDNTVDTVDVVPRTYNTCAPGLPFEFNWQVAFRTTMRNGFIIQRIDNTFNAAMCGGGAYTGWTPQPRYWEAWRVDANGNVTPALGGVNDMFTRPLLAGSSGNWVMRGTLYTTRTLPASFVLGSVADAGNLLRSTLNDPGSDFLGYVANTRRVGGTWNCCPPASTHTAS